MQKLQRLQCHRVTRRKKQTWCARVANKSRLKQAISSQKNSHLEERREVEKFGVRRFMASDSDIRFYTGLPDYATFIALYNFAKPKLGFSLNYYNDYTNASKDPSYIVSLGRTRNLCELDELFLTLTRLRLDLLEKDLGDRFKILQQEVSQTFATWIDRLYYCLGQLSFKTDRECPKAFKATL